MESPRLCRREVQKEGEAVRYCNKPIERVNALCWCPGCRQRLPIWPTGDSVEDPALSKPGAAPAPLTADEFQEVS